MRAVDGGRVGRVLRAVRQRRGLRQADVAVMAGLSQKTVSRVELGQLDGMRFEQLDRIAAALRVSVRLEARWLDGDADRLVDLDHAAVVERVVGALRGLGWTVVVEYGFNHFGERGSVDVLGWHPGERTLLVVEVKSRLTDLQATFTSLARKVRLVPDLVRRDPGWSPRHVGRLIVMPGSSSNRGVVERHAATFAAVLPERMPGLRAWLRLPDRPAGGVWFLTGRSGKTRRGIRRVRRAAGPR